MTDKHTIRTSDRATFRQCPELWNMTSKIRLNFEPLRPKAHFEVGTAWHAAMEALYDPEHWHDHDTKLHRAWKAFRDTTNDQQRNQEELGFGGPDLDIEFKERLELGRGMLEYYVGWSRINDDFEPVTVEHEFEVPITKEVRGEVWNLWYGDGDEGLHTYWTRAEGNVVYQGRIDGLVRDFTGAYWILEHKTAQKSGPTKWLMMDDQAGSYAWALQKMLGIPIKGIIYTRAFKQFPQPPKLLKSDGSVSCDKRQSTTAALFVEAVEQAHPFRPAAETITDDEKYFAYHQFLTSDAAPQFVERHWLIRNPNQIEDIGRRIAVEAQLMLDDPAIYPNVSSINCNQCAFFGPCLTKQEGGDWMYQLKSEYWWRGND
jgi:hypothetical protein